MEELETLEGTECPECPGPPPEFRLPPPPRPPFLTEGTFCSEAPLAELEDCVAIPMIDASYHTNPSLQSTALIITSAVILLLMAAIISVVFWKHKRKVQNLLPCKSAAGAAAAAAAASSRGRGGGGGGGVLPEGQGGSVLYEDLPDAVSHSQQRSGVQNHFANHLLQNSLNHVQHQYPGLPGHPLHQRPVQPTIEVREFPEAVVQKRSKAPAPAPHHLDYLDYRDPRAILRVADKPSRAVLGGYRTPRALLAKSQGVPFAMAASHANGPQNSILQGPQDPEIDRYHIRSTYGPITPTHRPRLGTPTRQKKNSPQLETRRDSRRPSVDSEGYSFVDFRRDNNSGGVRQSPTEQRLLGPETRRSNSVDSEGYSYILETNNRVRTPGVARRVVVSNEATEDEVCPLCTVQRIHGLLSRAEEAYRTGVTESS